MSHFGFTRPVSLLTGGSGNNSAITSVALCVADYQIITLSWETVTGSASTLTVQGSLADGFQSAIPATSWSVMTAVNAAGLYTVDPGARWIRAVRGSPDSASTVLVALRAY